jgi:hypothetical protein
MIARKEARPVSRQRKKYSWCQLMFNFRATRVGPHISPKVVTVTTLDLWVKTGSADPVKQAVSPLAGA